MSNQHTKKKAFKVVVQKCERKGCRNKVRRTPYKIKIGHNRFCSKTCSDMAKTATKYTPEVLAYICANHKTTADEEIAKHLCITVVAYRRQVYAMRAQGITVPHKRGTDPIGTIRTWKDRGYTRKRIKTASGWENVPSDKQYKNPKKGKKRISQFNIIPRPVAEQSKVFAQEGLIPKVEILLPGGRSSVVCDEDKREAVIKYLLRTG